LSVCQLFDYGRRQVICNIHSNVELVGKSSTLVSVSCSSLGHMKSTHICHSVGNGAGDESCGTLHYSQVWVPESGPGSSVRSSPIATLVAFCSSTQTPQAQKGFLECASPCFPLSSAFLGRRRDRPRNTAFRRS